MSRSIKNPNIAVNGSVNFNSQYALTRNEVNDLLTELNTSTFLNDITLLISEPIKNISNLFLYPFDVKKAFFPNTPLKDSNVIINIVTLKRTKGFSVTPLSLPPLKLGTFTIPRYFNSFLDYAPHTKIELYLPYIGTVQLDNDVVVGRKVKIRYAVSLQTGTCTAYLIVGDDENETVIMEREGKIGISITIGGGGVQEVANNLLKFGLSTYAGVKQGNNFLTANSITGGINAMQYDVKKSGSQSPNTSFFAPQNAYLTITRPKIVKPENYESLYGRPSLKKSALKDLTGFTQVEKIHVENINNALSDELDEIENLLKTGVIL